MSFAFKHALILSPVCFLFCQLLGAAEQAPQLRLPETVAPVSYRAELTLDPVKPDFTGLIEIKVNIKQPVQTIWLNGTQLAVTDAVLKLNGKSYNAKPTVSGGDFIGLQFASSLPAGSGDLTLHYSGKVRRQDSSGVFQMQDNGNSYLFTQFESTDARDAFPCFDEPGYKVPWQLTLSVPVADTAISNTSPEEEKKEGARRIYRFKPTKPLPSYLVAFAVGPFDYVDAGTAGKNHVPVRIVTPKGHAHEAKYAAEVTATILTRLEDYFGIPYPYDKSDNVAIPVTFGFGAMENAGMVTYGQTYILGNPATDTTGRQREYALVAAHELAHQWFGDLVTPVWWNDIWLNESFASWMEQKLVAEWKPEWKTRADDVASKIEAQDEDSLISARKIRQEIKTKDDISNAFDRITYQKGAAVISMFESWMGPETFRESVRGYLKQYAFRNSTAPEFLDSLSTSSKKNVTKAFFTFLNQAGVPLVSVALDCKQAKPTLHLEQQRFLPVGSKGSAEQLWNIPVCVRYGDGSSSENACTLMTQAKQDFALNAKACPAWVQANGDAVGYYRVEYKGNLLSSLISGDVQKRLNAPERVDFMGNAQALVNAGKLPMAEALKLVETFHADPDRHVVLSALDLALAPIDHLVPDNLEANYQRFLQKNFDAKARELSWTGKDGEPDDVRLLRPLLLRRVSTYGGDMELAKQARALTEQWFHNHTAIKGELQSAVLYTAAYYGDKALHDRFLNELKTSKDRVERARIIGALGSFRDPECLREGMQALLSDKVPFIEGGSLLFSGQRFAATRKIPLEFVKAHYDQILEKRPTGGGFDFGADLPRVGELYCDVNSKEQLKSFFEPRVNKLVGAPRTLAQVLENVDVCIASRPAQQAQVEAFLKNY